MKSKDLKVGDSVTWNSQQGNIQGKVVKKIKKSEVVKVGAEKKRSAKGSEAEPKVLVKSNKTGKQAVHNPTALKKGPEKRTRKKLK